MQINSINSTSGNSFRAQVIPFQTVINNTQIKNTTSTSAVNPEYYQALYGISDSKDSCVQAKFNEIYRCILHNMRNQEEKSITELEECVVPEASNVVEMDTSPEYMNEKLLEMLRRPLEDSISAEDDYITSIKGQPKKELVESLIECHKNNLATLPQKAQERTEKIFRLSKTPKGYEFSDIDEKNHLVELLDEMSLQFGDNVPEEDLYTAVELTRNSEGRLDFELIKASLNLIYDCGFVVDLAKVITMLSKYRSYDFENMDKINDTLNELNKTMFAVAETDSFEEMADLCFDKNSKFDTKRKEALMELISILDNWISSQMKVQTRKDFIGEAEKYKNCTIEAKRTINDYFSDYTNSEGKFNPELTPQEYIELRLSKIIVM
ncbi:MAG: hypothetical protein IJ877_06480 [Candidatus Gastranaerophilales bacterium]|nr:hypothetical protein [Candidatus Gastranaerophilales bacterium]